ncbi:STAS domain-containing protein [Verrucomicrobiota bacterium]
MISFAVDGEKIVCSFTERMDTGNCMKCEEELYEKIRESKLPVVFDLGKVDYVASMFLRICMRVVSEAEDGNFSIINVRPHVKKVFKISGIDRGITIS